MPLRSLWQDRQHVAARTGTVPDGASAPWDVVVVGGGLTGVTTALLLSRAGQRVLLLEAASLGQGTTGRSTAKVSLLQGLTLSRIRRHHSRAVLTDYVTGHREAQAWIARYCEDHGVAVQVAPAYTYAVEHPAARRLDAELLAARETGLAVDRVDDLPLPYPVEGALRLADQLQVDPLQLLDALAAEAARHGATLVEGARVLKVRGNGPFDLTVGVGDARDQETSVRAARVVVATNMPFLDRGGFFARMSPQRSYSLAFRTHQPAVDGMYLSVDSSTRSLRTVPDAGGDLLLVGGNGHVTGRSTPTSVRLDELRAWTHEWFPGARETHAWSAQDYAPARVLPYAGAVLPGQDRLLVAGGFGKWGMTGAVAAALAVTADLLGGRVDWAESWRPWRRQELSGLPEAALFNAAVGLEMTRGWLPPLQRRGTGRHVCTHLGGRLTHNDAEGSWDCPLHGSRFDEDGDVLEGPAVCPVRSLRA